MSVTQGEQEYSKICQEEKPTTVLVKAEATRLQDTLRIHPCVSKLDHRPLEVSR